MAAKARPARISAPTSTWLARAATVSASGMSEPPEQTLRAHHQHDDHDPEHDRIGPYRRDVERGDRLHLGEKQARQDGAGDTPHAADDDDRERHQDEVAAHGREHGIDRRQQNAREARERYAEG